MQKIKFHPFSRRMAVRLSISICLIFNTVLIIGYLYNRNEHSLNFFRLSYAFISNFILLISLYSYNFNIFKRKLPRGRRIWSTLLGSIFIAVVVSLFFDRLTLFLKIDFGLPQSFFLIANLMKDLVSVLVVLLSTYLINSIYQHQQTLLENEKLMAENIRIRYEVLKSQVDPHFLFNSLNTLDGLISINTDQAHEYVQNLSSVFRYAISKKEIMHLDEELNFTESYANLMKIRYGENLQINYTIDDKYRSFFIMPVSLQLLVENAIKHNVISNKQPLIIHIESTPNDTVKVWNVIQPKNEAGDGEGIGLANLSERYALVFNKEVLITSTDIFSVEIPLVKQLDSEKTKIETNYGNDFCYRRR